MTLLQPIWLLLLIPLVAAWRAWRMPTRFLHWSRAVMLLAIVLAAAGLSLKLPQRAGTVVIVADRSRSMPTGSDATEKELIGLIQKEMSGNEELAVVTFGESAAIERAPQSGAFAGFTNDVGADASNLSEGIARALSLIPKDAPSRIVVLSDGRYTGREPSAPAAQAAARGIPIDFRTIQRPTTNDTAISRLDAPATITPGEGFVLTVWARSPSAQEGGYEVLRNGQPIAAGKTNFTAGLNRLAFRDVAGEGGTLVYSVRVTGTGEDPIPENNSAKMLVGVRGPKPLLVVSPAANSGLARLFVAGGLRVDARTSGQMGWTLEELSNFSGVVIENVPADKVGTRGMENLAAWVRDTGGGLLMTGGKNSYAPGGYFKSPLEAVMPVSMELRQEHRKLALAMVVAMDRSGSMAAPVGGGRTKMDLADLAAVQVLDLLTPMDEFGCIAVDSSAHTIADIGPVNNKEAVRSRVLRVQSEGGGIFIYQALAASADMILKAQPQTKHVILFADAADSEEPGDYKNLIEKMRQADITISVIGLGKPTDSDAELLRDIAKRGSGRCYFTEDPGELPRLFAQDTFVVARSTFLDQPTPFSFTGGMVTLAGKSFPAPPALGGYNLCYVRPTANLAAVTKDEYNAPVVASWQAGIGRVACYTGEADGQFAGPLAGWASAGEFYTSLGRWTAGASENLPPEMLATQEIRNGVCYVRLDLDPTRQNEPFAGTPTVNALTSTGGGPPTSKKLAMQWTSADTLSVELPLKGSQTAISTVEVPNVGTVTLPPVTLPYSPEFAPAEPGEGAETLDKLAKATGGRELLDLSGLWRTLPKRSRFLDLSPWLIGLALLLLLIEVLERRTGLVTAWRPAPAEALGKLSAAIPRPTGKKSAKPVVSTPKPKAEPAQTAAQPKPEAPKAQPSTQPGVIDALSRARKQADERNKR